MNELVKSYYEATVSRSPPSAVLTGDITADVCVIGGGYTGLSCALELAQAGRRVVILEAAQVGWGCSGRNGGQVLFGYSRGDLSAPARQAGVSEKYLFDLTVDAVALLKSRIKTYAIDCDWRDGYLLAAIHERHRREAAEDAEMLSRFGYPVRLLDAAETRAHIASRRYCAALLDKQGGHFHPLKYVLGLARAATEAGAQLYENTAALSVVEKNGEVEVRTANGLVKCQQVALAGNAYLTIAPSIGARIMPVGTYIGATEPLGEEEAHNLILGHCVCDMNFVLDYFRCSVDGRMLFGGRVSYLNREPPNLEEKMRQRMTAVFPQLADKRFDYLWGGSVAITMSRFPDLGRQGNHVYYAQGFSGHGAALSGFAGKILAAAMSGDAEKLDVFARIKHTNFVGGKMLRAPILALAMWYYRMRDLLG